MTPMKELSDDFKLSVRSISEVMERLKGAHTRAKSSKRVQQWDGEKLKNPTQTGLVNAILLHYLEAMPREEQIEAAARGMRLLNAYLMEGVAGGADAEERPGPAVHEESVHDDSGRAPRKRRGNAR